MQYLGLNFFSLRQYFDRGDRDSAKKFSFSAVAAMALMWSAPSFADECDAILIGGTFDQIIVDTKRSISEQTISWLKIATYEAVKDKIDAGVTIPIEEFPVGGNFTRESFGLFQKRLNSGEIKNLSEKEATAWIKRTASAIIADAWVACKNNNSPGIHLDASIDPSAPQNVFFALRFNPLDEKGKLPKITSFTVTSPGIIDHPEQTKVGTQVTYQPIVGTISRPKVGGNPIEYPGITISVNTTIGGKTKQVKAFKFDDQLPDIKTQIFAGLPVGPMPHPVASATVPAGYKLIGGGARVTTQGPGSLLTASYPSDAMTWTARAKDHRWDSPGTLEVWAIGLYDPNNEWEVGIFQASSAATAHPEVQVQLPHGYAMTSGGALVTYAGPGNLLTASYPASDNLWIARSKDHEDPDPAALTGYVIGIRPRVGGKLPIVHIDQAVTSVAAHPSASVNVSSADAQLSGGGAYVDWHGAGNLLTAAFPASASGFAAAAKDHDIDDPAALHVFAISIQSRPKSDLPSAINWAGGFYISAKTGERTSIRNHDNLLDPNFIDELQK